jgi:quercetin dioxygenase-like cupin family protein
MMLMIAAHLFLLSASPSASPSPVPITAEPRHHLRFENAYVRVFDVEVAPGDQTLYHEHDHDYVFVTFGKSHVVSERADGASTELFLDDGETRFTPAPLVHRARNLAATPFHNLTVEILATPHAPPEPPLPAMPGHSVLFENEKIRIDRQVLEPGQSTGMHRHALTSLGICVDGGRIEYREPDGKSVTADLVPGEFNWHGEPREHSLKNVGKSTFVAVEIEWK